MPPSTKVLVPSALPGWRDDDLSGLRDALARQCALARPPDPWTQACRDLPASPAALRAWIETRMSARALTGEDGRAQGLFTGYHEPELTGTRQRVSPAQVPLYRRPPAGQAGARADRETIERDSPLAGLELAWVDDAVEAFFLQVQGSGRIRLRDGATMRVGYAGDNGHAYHAIGRTLVERREIEPAALDADAIKSWLREHPDQSAALMRTNPRYVFFRELPPPASDEGPPGSLGVPLTPGRSVAVDPSVIPPGSLLWLETTDPLDGRALTRLMVAQDTGAAIRGTVRADVFWGPGPQAALRAARMKQPGRMWLLAPAR